ncbi:MAG: glycosyltransferase [Syntrophorhabdaceae bacterium]
MISIVIPVFNNLEMTEECIQTIIETTPACEIIVVDNGSDPAFHWGFVSMHDVRIIRNEENKGFPVAVNQGIRAAKGETIILLNNDVFVTPGWSERLTGPLDNKPIEVTEFGDKEPKYACYPFSIVGPMTNYVAGLQKAQASSYANKDELNEAAAEWAENFGDEIQEVNFVIGFCMAFKRSLFDELGDFDESLWPCSGEEIDFCFRAREAGHRVGIVAGCYVHHEGSQTFKVMDADYEAICKRNDAHLAEKWGENVWTRQAVMPEIEGVRLNMGCGPFPMEGFINIDQFEAVNPDLLCDVMALPYEPGTVSEIYAGHILEHFMLEDGKKALRYWLSLLRPGGIISVVVPDYDFLCKEYVKNPTPERLIEFNDTYIYSGIQPSPHLYAYSAALLEKVLKDAGFVNLAKMPVNHPYFPFAVDWQVGFQGVKP